MSNHYELIFILKPDQSAEEAQASITRIKELISRNEGEILKEDDWGIRQLAYEMNKQTKGHYILLYFTAKSSVVADLEQNFNVMEETVKYMVVRLEKAQIEAYRKKAEEAASKSAEPEASETGPYETEAAETEPEAEAPATEEPAEA